MSNTDFTKLDPVVELLGDESKTLLEFSNPKINKENLTLPNKDIVENVYFYSDRNNRVLRNLYTIYNAGRLANTGYLSILPIDQGVEHSAGAAFSKNIQYFNPENIVKLAVTIETVRGATRTRIKPVLC
jgi:class I fructose-bisphosphate aldolase